MFFCNSTWVRTKAKRGPQGPIKAASSSTACYWITTRLPKAVSLAPGGRVSNAFTSSDEEKAHWQDRISFLIDGNGGKGASSPVPNPNVEGRAARKEAVMVRGCGIGGIIMAFGEDERCRWAVGENWVQTQHRRWTSLMEMPASRSAVHHKSN